MVIALAEMDFTSSVSTDLWYGQHIEVLQEGDTKTKEEAGLPKGHDHIISAGHNVAPSLVTRSSSHKVGCMLARKSPLVSKMDSAATCLA